jgi:translation initiation factor 2B subunit (eIF-2B alpha/beta/delta family)
MEDKKEIKFEGSIATWDCNLIGSINGSYVGTFKFRAYLNPIQKLSASRMYRELLGNSQLPASPTEDNLAFAISQLKHRIVEAPPFWSSGSDLGTIPDEEVLMSILDAAIASEIMYREDIKNKKQEAIEKAKKAAEKILQNKESDQESED